MSSRNSIVRPTVLAVALPAIAALSAALPGCARTQTMQSSLGQPASEGTVKATEGDNGNTNLTIKVKHLAPPSRIAPDATVYVVWIQPGNGARQSVGRLTLNDNLEGTLNTVTPHRRFALTVTPEPSGQVAHPTHPPVFVSQVERR